MSNRKSNPQLSNCPECGKVIVKNANRKYCQECSFRIRINRNRIWMRESYRAKLKKKGGE